MSDLVHWLERHTSHAPTTLAARTRHYAFGVASQPTLAETLASSARAALTAALAQPADRSSALDLLAGDALVTLALLAQAEDAPGRLGEFAQALLRPERLAP